MFRTHTSRKNNETSNCWFVINSFNDSIASPRHLLQSINTISELKTIVKNGARSVSEVFGELVDNLKSSTKLSRSILKYETVEVSNNRYDLRELPGMKRT